MLCRDNTLSSLSTYASGLARLGERWLKWSWAPELEREERLLCPEFPSPLPQLSRPQCLPVLMSYMHRNTGQIWVNGMLPFPVVPHED